MKNATDSKLVNLILLQNETDNATYSREITHCFRAASKEAAQQNYDMAWLEAIDNEDSKQFEFCGLTLCANDCDSANNRIITLEEWFTENVVN